MSKSQGYIVIGNKDAQRRSVPMIIRMASKEIKDKYKNTDFVSGKDKLNFEITPDIFPPKTSNNINRGVILRRYFVVRHHSSIKIERKVSAHSKREGLRSYGASMPYNASRVKK